MTPTREQVIDMSIASGLNDRLRLDSEASRILSVQCLERFATLAMAAGRDQGLREAKEVCEAMSALVVKSNTSRGRTNSAAVFSSGLLDDCATAIEQLRASA